MQGLFQPIRIDSASVRYLSQLGQMPPHSESRAFWLPVRHPVSHHAAEAGVDPNPPSTTSSASSTKQTLIDAPCRSAYRRRP